MGGHGQRLLPVKAIDDCQLESKDFSFLRFSKMDTLLPIKYIFIELNSNISDNFERAAKF